jgi:hypothetical protein
LEKSGTIYANDSAIPILELSARRMVQLDEKRNLLSLSLPLSIVYNQPGVGAHVCNPRYSGGRDQEDQGSKPAQASK